MGVAASIASTACVSSLLEWAEFHSGVGDLPAEQREVFELVWYGGAKRKEAAAIAVAMRLAIEDGKTVALVTPDRTLGRRVTSTLRRWNIVPDDSAGRPLAQTAPGRLLRQIAHLTGEKIRSEDLIALLRHPLTQTDGADRGPHLLMTQEFELFLRKKAVLYVSDTDLIAFADVDPRRTDWAAWVATVVPEVE